MTDHVKNLTILELRKVLLKTLKVDQPYALFYKDEAFHIGRPDVSSHRYIHIEEKAKMIKVNKDCVRNRTGVTVTDAKAIRKKVINKTL